MDDMEKLSRAYNDGSFDPFITRIRFPYLKRMQPGMEIRFDFPITAIVGPNGTNKTTILRALESCPAGKSLSDYWFETSLDTIDTSRGAPRYIHEYRVPSGKMAEVRKMRIKREDRKAEYFEPTRPRKIDSMREMPERCSEDEPYRTDDRWKPIPKDVVYLDFRAQLPAYDILMSFDWRYGFPDVDAKKKLVRNTSRHLKAAMEQLSHSRHYRGREKLLRPVEDLGKDEVEAIGSILGKDYKRIRLVQHEFYNCFGWTAVLETEGLEYSEAFAGSGEFAVTMLVHAVKKANKKSLILLDEPETSLHPGAQKGLVSFLARETLVNKHQVIMSTHSAAMIEGLPNKARKLLASDSLTGEVFLAAGSTSIEESFVRLGATYGKRMILVEDRLAAEIVLAAARKEGDAFLQTIETVVIPGGAGTLRTREAVACAMKDDACIIIFDGDQRLSEALLEREIADGELENELHKFGISDRHLYLNGGMDGGQQQLFKTRRKVLNWFKTHIGFLPESDCPENLILMMGNEEPKPTPDEAKSYWEAVAKKQLGKSESEGVTSDNIFQVQQEYLASFEDGECFKSVLCELRRLLG